MIPYVSHLLSPSPMCRGAESGTCSIVNCGYRGNDLLLRDASLQSLTSNVTAAFSLISDLICPHCCETWNAPAKPPAKKFNRAFLATSERILFPVISADSETLERPIWADALRYLDPDLPRAVLLTTDPKKRIWPFTRASAGDSCWLYLHDPARGISGNRAVSLAQLRRTLNLIESVLANGFNKTQIGQSLFLAQSMLLKLGLASITGTERQLAEHRTLPEFLPALIVAQPPPKEINAPKSKRA